MLFCMLSFCVLVISLFLFLFFFFFQAEDGIRDHCVTGVQTCALPILLLKSKAPFTTDSMNRCSAPTMCHARSTAGDRKSTRLNSSHTVISYAVFCLKQKRTPT